MILHDATTLAPSGFHSRKICFTSKCCAFASASNCCASSSALVRRCRSCCSAYCCSISLSHSTHLLPIARRGAMVGVMASAASASFIFGEEAAGDERLVERLSWQVDDASLWRARRRDAVAAAPGRGGLARGARGEVGLRGSERTEHGEERSNEFTP